MKLFELLMELMQKGKPDTEVAVDTITDGTWVRYEIYGIDINEDGEIMIMGQGPKLY